MQKDFIPEGKEKTEVIRHHHYDFIPDAGIGKALERPPINRDIPSGAPLLANDYLPERIPVEEPESSGDRKAAAAVETAPEKRLAPEPEPKRIGRPPKPKEPLPEPAPSRKSRANPTEEEKGQVEAPEIPDGWEQTGVDGDGQPIIRRVKGSKGGEAWGDREVSLGEVLGHKRPDVLGDLPPGMDGQGGGQKGGGKDTR